MLTSNAARGQRENLGRAGLHGGDQGVGPYRGRLIRQRARPAGGAASAMGGGQTDIGICAGALRARSAKHESEAENLTSAGSGNSDFS